MRIYRKLALAVALITAPFLHAQTPQWSQSITGQGNAPAFLGDGYIITRTLAVDGSGNVVASGSTRNGAQSDFLTTKLASASGAVVWQKTFAGAAGKDDDALAVAVDASGNAIVGGLSFNTAGGIEIKVIKYAAGDGAVLWERAIPGGTFSAAYAVVVDAAGNAFIGAESNATGTSDIRVLKLAASTGATLWEQVYNGGADDYISDLAVDRAGDVIVTGVSANTSGNDDFKIIKYSGASGTLAWQQSYNGGTADEAYALALDASGNAFVTGYTRGANADFKTIKYAAATGAIAWQVTFDGGRNDYAQSVAVDAGGNAVVVGQVQNAAGNYDFKTIKYAAANGAILWQTTFDGGGEDYAYQVAVDAAGNAIVTGSTSNGTNADWKTIAYAGADGAVLFAHQYNGSANQSDEAYALAVTTGAVYVGGIAMDGSNFNARVTKLTNPVNDPGGNSATAPGVGSTNVALASAGGVVTASSTWNANFPVTALNNNERAGAAWARGATWTDATASTYPDWVQVDFSAAKTIDRVVVYSVQDNYASPAEPTDTMTFSALGVTDFTVQSWNGTAWVDLAAVSGNNRVKRVVTFAPVTTARIRVQINNSPSGYSRLAEIEAWSASAGSAPPPPPPPASGATNVALASSGGVATASSTWNANFPVTALNNNERTGATWARGGTWSDATGAYPDWVQIAFDGSKTIDRVVLYSVQDNYASPAEPTDALTFTSLGVTDFTVQAWNGAAWVDLASVNGNNRVKRTVTFTAVTTDRIRIQIHNALGGYSRLAEVEAWGTATGTSTPPPPPPPTAPSSATNLALASAGGVVTASSTWNANFPVTALNNDERAGVTWARGGSWADGTFGVYPDWVQIAFPAAKAVERVVLYTVQDDYANPAEPTDAMNFSTLGVTDFTVQGWNGASWVTLATVTGNTAVKRTVSFSSFTTDRIRIQVDKALGPLSRLTEVEAWGR